MGSCLSVRRWSDFKLGPDGKEPLAGRFISRGKRIKTMDVILSPSSILFLLWVLWFDMVTVLSQRMPQGARGLLFHFFAIWVGQRGLRVWGRRRREAPR